MNVCLFCNGDSSAPDHRQRCDGRQGALEARHLDPIDVQQIVEDTDDPREGTITERAERFHRRNPSVYTFAVSVSRYTKSKGVQHYGIGAVWEIMRFKYLETHGDIYKLNNNYRAWYARRIMQNEPDLANFFTTRACPNDAEYRTREVA